MSHITPKGYRIPLEDERVKKLSKELTVKPFIPNYEFSKEYRIYRKSEKYFYGPRFYMLKECGVPECEIYHDFKTVEINIKSDLRDYQKDPGEKILNHIKTNFSCICSLYTGWGKTFLALWLASKLKYKTLIIVHTRTLLDQWCIKIKEFLNIDAGIIQQDNVNVDSFVCVGMIHSLCIRNYSKYVTDSFGFVIFDEVHHMPSEFFSNIFYKIAIKYSLGLSATLKRADGLSKVLNWFLGETAVELKQISEIPLIEFHKFVPTEIFEEKFMNNGKINTPAMINDICDREERNIFIENIIRKLYNDNRKILILTDRRNHCLNLLSKLNDLSSGVYLGGMSLNDLSLTNGKKIIIATYAMASEGYDNPELDTLVLASPKSNIEQSVGRILRQKNKNEPLIIDIQDIHSVFNGMNNKRKQFYKQKGFIKSSKSIEYSFRE